MKKLLLTSITMGMCFAVTAQQVTPRSIKTLKPQKWDKAIPAQTVFTTGNEMPLTNPNVTTFPQHSSKTSMLNTIGCTTYDLQSNGAISNRILNVNGNVGATWTTSNTNDLAASDRGSGYNYYTSGAWGTASTTCIRVEPIRTGWPSYAVTALGTEHITSHISGSPLFRTYRGTAGSGAWDTTRLAPIGPPEVLWGRTVAGGANGNSLHTLCITLPIGNAGALVNGLDGCPQYYRSEDNGATWNIVGSVPQGVDSLTYDGWSADSYAIDAKGSTVAYTHGQITEDWSMWKSTDNGGTWTKTIVQDFPFTKYDDATSITDVDGDGIADTITTVDHKVAILIDNNGMVHCWAGALQVLDDDPAAALGLFLSTDGLLYWNESMGSNPPVVIASTPDIDGNGTFDVPAGSDGVCRYNNGGFTSMPDAAIDANGKIVVSFVCPIENTQSGQPSPANFMYRNSFLIASDNGGATWGTPVRIDPSDFDEKVYATLSRDIVGPCIDLIWMQDALPCIAVQPPITGNQTSHPFGNNSIIHDCIDLSTIPVSVNALDTKTEFVTVAPNPTSDLVTLTYKLTKPSAVKIEVVNITGQIVMQKQFEATTSSKQTLSLASLAKGIYSVNSIINGEVISNIIIKQ